MNEPKDLSKLAWSVKNSCESFSQANNQTPIQMTVEIELDFVLVNQNTGEYFREMGQDGPIDVKDSKDALPFISKAQADRVREAFKLSLDYIGGRPTDR